MMELDAHTTTNRGRRRQSSSLLHYKRSRSNPKTPDRVKLAFVMAMMWNAMAGPVPFVDALQGQRSTGPRTTWISLLAGASQPERENSTTTTSLKKQHELEYAQFVKIHDGDLDALQAQAAKLRAEADSLRSSLEESKKAKQEKELSKIDGWIEDLLFLESESPVELLKTVDQVTETLREERYSAEQVLKIFQRLCDIKEQESRSNCSPLMELLVDATGKLDCTERDENPNKRWNHKVERVLRKKLFARDWNIHYVSDEEQNW